MVIDTSINTTIENIDVDTFFTVKDIQEKKQQIKTNCFDSNISYLDSEEYIKLQFEEMKLKKEDYELF